MDGFFIGKKISELVFFRELNSTEAVKLRNAQEDIVRIAQHELKSIPPMIEFLKIKGYFNVNAFGENTSFINTFLLHFYRNKEELMVALILLEKNLVKMQKLGKLKVLVGNDTNPIFQVADAVTVPFLPGRPIVIKEGAFKRHITDFRSLLAHEASHSLLYTSDYYMEEDPRKRLKDAYAYEKIFGN